MNGNGSGKETHLSLFLTVMRGDFDVLLKWPFSQTVTFTLLDLDKDGNRDIVLWPDLVASYYTSQFLVKHKSVHIE